MHERNTQRVRLALQLDPRCFVGPSRRQRVLPHLTPRRPSGGVFLVPRCSAPACHLDICLMKACPIKVGANGNLLSIHIVSIPFALFSNSYLSAGHTKDRLNFQPKQSGGSHDVEAPARCRPGSLVGHCRLGRRRMGHQESLARRSSEAAKDITTLIQSSNQVIQQDVQLVRSAGDALAASSRPPRRSPPPSPPSAAPPPSRPTTSTR